MTVPLHAVMKKFTPAQRARVETRAKTLIEEELTLRDLPPTIPNVDSLSEDEALLRPEILLKPRIEETERGEVANQTATEIVAELKRERHARPL